MIINPNITDNELAAELHTTVDSIITAKICCSPITYLQNTVYDNDNNSITFEDLLADNDEFESVINNIYLYEALNKLDDKAKNIIRLRYFNDMTQSDVSNVLGVSQAQVSRLEKKAINNLRELLKNNV